MLLVVRRRDNGLSGNQFATTAESRRRGGRWRRGEAGLVIEVSKPGNGILLPLVYGEQNTIPRDPDGMTAALRSGREKLLVRRRRGIFGRRCLGSPGLSRRCLHCRL